MSVVRPAYSFLNIESLRQSEQKGFYGSTNFKFTGATGNTDKSIGVLATQNSFHDGANEVLLLSQYSYGEAGGEKDTNKGNLHLRYSNYLYPYFAVETYGQLEFNEFTDLDLRKLIGGGGRFRLLKEEATSLFLGAGVFYESERLETQEGQKNGRGNIYTSLRHLVAQAVEVTVILYYQPSTERVDDYRLQGTLGLDFKLYKNISFTAEGRYSFDSKPPPAVKRTDFTYLTGLQIKY